MTAEIRKVVARELFDSRGNPTVETEVWTDKSVGRFIVPSGASTGEYEAVELRDGGNRFLGKGVQKAVKNVNDIIGPKVIGMDVLDQETLDKTMIELDGTPNKGKLGANAILSVSIAALKAAAMAEGKHVFQYIGNNTKLPNPSLNIINGGKHAGGDLAIQEFMIIPHGFPTIREGLRGASEVYHYLKKFLKEKYGASAINVGDEGGFAPPLDFASDAISAIETAIENAGYQIGKEISVGLDPAASEFFKDGKYHVDTKKLTPDEMVDYYVDLVKQHPIITLIEDPFEENAFDTFAALVKKIGSNIDIVGDDLTVTNVNRIETAIKQQSMNYLLLKVNQIGTFTESKAAFDLSKKQGWGVMISHRSGETEDSFIADLAVGLGAEKIKSGAPARSERLAKYNQLMRIEEILGDKAQY